MRLSPYLLPALLLTACIENNLEGEDAPPGLSVPPPFVDPIQEDRTVQVVQPVVDILFVVDNSSSMGPEQVALRNNFPRFIEHFVNAGIDYHIAMVSTEMQRAGHRGLLRQGNGVSYITDETHDPAGTFLQMTNSLGVFIASQESGRAAAYTALETLRVHPRNEGFMRDDADLHIIFVTDDDDYSGGDPVTLNEFREWSENLKANEFTTTMHGIITPDPACNDNFVSTSYLAYAAGTGGITHSICASDWAPALDALGMQAAGLRREFFLTRIPVRFPELEIEVQVRTVDENGDPLVIEFVECRSDQEGQPGFEDCEVVYHAGRNSIVFLNYVPDALAEVLITYGVAENNSAGG